MCTEYNGPQVFDLPMPSNPCYLARESRQPQDGSFASIQSGIEGKQREPVDSMWLLYSVLEGPFFRMTSASATGRWSWSQLASRETGELSFLVPSIWNIIPFYIICTFSWTQLIFTFLIAFLIIFILLFFFSSLLCVSLLFYGSLHPDLCFSLFLNLCVFVAASVSLLGLCFSVFVFPRVCLYISSCLSFSMFCFPL